MATPSRSESEAATTRREALATRARKRHTEQKAGNPDHAPGRPERRRLGQPRFERLDIHPASLTPISGYCWSSCLVGFGVIRRLDQKPWVWEPFSYLNMAPTQRSAAETVARKASDERLVAVWCDDRALGAGHHTVVLAPAGLSAGVYIVRLSREGARLTTRSILLR